MDILHAMADALIKYETIDKSQIDDLMARKPVKAPDGWDDTPPKGGHVVDANEKKDEIKAKPPIGSAAEQS